MANNSGEGRQQSGESSASTPNPNPDPWDTPKYPNFSKLWNTPDYNPWNTHEYEAVCRAQREKADRKNLERWGPQKHSSQLNENYSAELLGRPAGWETCPNPTPQDLDSLYYAPPWPGYHCSICGSSNHFEIYCSYLVSFPRDGCLQNHDAYEIVCQCGKAIVGGGYCTSGYCHPNRPRRVINKSQNHLCLPSSFGIHDLSYTEPSISWDELCDQATLPVDADFF